MAKGAGDTPASRSIVSTLGTLILAILLVAFGFWAGRTFEALWPSTSREGPPQTVAALSPAPSPTLEPSPSPSPSIEPSPAGTPSPDAAAAEPAAPAASRRTPPRRPAPTSAPTTPALPAAPPPSLPPLADPPRRPFVLGTTVVESLKPATTEVPGFEPAGLGVKRAPEVPGRLDFEVSPQPVKPGEAYAVKVYLVNDGGKPIAVEGLNVAMMTDGKRSARAMPPRARSVAPKERALLAELPGVWKDGSWALEVAVTSKRQDRYTNTLNWK